ncbi:MAG: GNAT family N-acetyltransferase [Chloroflexi bacterium]|nr:GNAT family N-acetyltransferase [Chloroflexota bacterium]
MRIHNRSYEEMLGDFERIWRFLLQDYAYRKDQFIWLFSRFGDWKYGLWNRRKYFPSFYRKNAQLWLNDFQELEGFVISEEGDHGFTLFTRRGYEHITGEMLDWVVNHWANRGGALRTEVHEYQDQYMDVLGAHSFANKGYIATTRQYDLRGNVRQDVELSEGYRIVDMAVNHDYESKQRVAKNAFRGEDGISEIELLTYEYARECPCYQPAFDLSAIDPVGVHASSCVGFVDYENRVSEVEKVCTHSSYRRQHLAEAVIKACFVRLKAAGFEYAYITGYSHEANALYEKLGPVKRKEWSLYEVI